MARGRTGKKKTKKEAKNNREEREPSALGFHATSVRAVCAELSAQRALISDVSLSSGQSNDIPETNRQTCSSRRPASVSNSSDPYRSESHSIFGENRRSRAV